MRGSFWMLAAAFFFALMASFTKFASTGFGSFELVFYRAIFGAICIGTWVVATGRSLKTPLFFAHFKRSFLGNIALTIWFYAIAHLPLGTAMTLNYTSPLYMAIFLTILALRNKKNLNLGLVGAIIAGFVGVTLILHPEVNPENRLPALIGLSAGFFSALAYWQVKELSKMKEPEWRIVFYFTVYGAIWGLGGQILVDEIHVPQWSDFVPLFGLGLSGTLAQLTMTLAWSRGNMYLTSALQFSAIIFATLIGLTFFDEVVPLESWIGIAVIIAAGITSTILAKKK